ncbi:MAG: hypothetical protein IPI02_18225 [Sterolibacteriaceae bacterium]|nr:hypothetical protein [Sterolibacteriaceae bacterium]
MFKSEKILGSLYQQLAREAVLSVKAEQIATFLGKKITPQLAAEIELAPEHALRNLHQAQIRIGLYQDLRQVRSHPAHRDHNQ